MSDSTPYSSPPSLSIKGRLANLRLNLSRRPLRARLEALLTTEPALDLVISTRIVPPARKGK